MAAKTTRAVVTLVVLASLALAGAAGVRAADPTLGASFGPTVLYGSDPEPALLVINRSELPVLATLVLDKGWEVAETSFPLNVDEVHYVLVTRVGTGDGHATLRLVGAGTWRPSSVGGEIALTVRLAVERPFDPVPYALIGLVVIGALLILYIVIRWLRRNLRVSIGRAS